MKSSEIQMRINRLIDQSIIEEILDGEISPDRINELKSRNTDPLGLEERFINFTLKTKLLLKEDPFWINFIEQMDTHLEEIKKYENLLTLLTLLSHVPITVKRQVVFNVLSDLKNHDLQKWFIKVSRDKDWLDMYEMSEISALFEKDYVMIDVLKHYLNVSEITFKTLIHPDFPKIIYVEKSTIRAKKSFFNKSNVHEKIEEALLELNKYSPTIKF